MSELPRMYHNKIDKDLNNNERVFSTLDSNIIHTNSFINKVIKRIIGKNKNNLITMDNEYIPINTIRDIYINK